MVGVEEMLRRTGKVRLDHTLTRGPGNVSKALGLATHHTGHSLLRGDDAEIFIGDDGMRYRKAEIGASPRIGVDYAGPDAELPYRYFVRGNPFLSGKAALNKGD
jgi:DNA-3-methyladenine glycosylase